jgi:hypothetical protein
MTFPNPIYTPLGPAAREETAATSSANNDAAYTFTDQALGAAAPDRYVVIAVVLRDAGGLPEASTVTVQGISATEAVGVTFNNTTEAYYASLWIAAVPTGTTGTVVVTGNATMTDCAISLYRVTGIASPTPSDTDTDSGDKSLFSMDLDVQSRGIAIGVAIHETHLTAATWTGLTEDEDAQADNIRYTAASEAFSVDANALAITVTLGADNGAAACAHWASA